MSTFPDVRTISACAKLFPATVDSITSVVTQAKEQAALSLGSIYSASPPTWDSVLAAGDRAMAVFSISQSIIGIVKETSPNKDVREAAIKNFVELESFAIENFQCNRQLYQRVKDYVTANEAEVAVLPKERAYFLKETLSNYKRLGLELPDEKFMQLVEMNKKLSELGSVFSKNIAEDNSTILVDENALEGVPQDAVSKLEKKDGKIVLGVDYPTYFAVIKNCSNSDTRQRLATAFENRAYPPNLAVLHDLIALRQKMANLIGFQSYASYDLDSKMARTVNTAQEFVQSLVPPLQKKWALELEELKKNLPPGVELIGNGEIRMCDLPYCMNYYKEKFLNVNENLIKEYFPLDTTVKGLFEVYEAFFGIKFEKVTGDFWAPEVFGMAVTNKEGTLLGHILLDLFPREGKFSHACCSSIVPSVSTTGSPALAVVLCNFPTPTGDKPALFTHDDVETFFHEFGHAIHALMGRCEMTTLASYNVKTDFVELPSQMLQEWMWDAEILQKITSHYSTKEALPLALIEAKINARNFFSGRDSLRQLNFALLSLQLYSLPFAGQETSSMDSDAVVRSIQREILPNVVPLDGTHFQCNFGHLEGYGASYYGYMWSEVFALDVFACIRTAKGLLDSTIGARYVKSIIGRGGSADPMELLVDFLGRSPDKTAFLKKLGI